jgi:hypothetical protein
MTIWDFCDFKKLILQTYKKNLILLQNFENVSQILTNSEQKIEPGCYFAYLSGIKIIILIILIKTS